jgi:uncharacterized surface protein with fasciclin (FAS1) repeats/uncharacterized protein YbjT (DUF2867 family)
MAGVHTAYYLVHSMGATEDFAALDRDAAREFGRAARDAGVRRIIYLGGLGEPSDDLSAHLKSRQETGDILRQSGVPVVEFRASIVIGSGSLSFEMVRALVERLPVLVCPKWVAVAAQPIGIEDVTSYLVAALDLPEGEAGVFPIGGPDVVSYGDIMREYARQRGLRRILISVPVLTPRLSSLWLGLVTPLYARVGRKLIDSLRNPTIVRGDSALGTFPVRPRSLRETIARAARLEDTEQAATRWSDALSSGGVRPARWGGARLGTRIVDSRAVTVEAPPFAAFAPVRRIGGAQGWYCGNALWRLRGFLDLLVGGIGMRRGRRDPDVPHPGDALDCWRVEAYEPDCLLRLAAEMKIPGRAWLQFEVTPRTGGGSEIRQTAIFDPCGLAGLLYWYALYPLHAFIFHGMLAGIAARASSASSQSHERSSRNPRPRFGRPRGRAMESLGAFDIRGVGTVADAVQEGGWKMKVVRTLKNSLIPMLVAIGLVAWSVLPSVADTHKDIVDTAVSAGQFNTLAKALTEAGLVETLKGKGPFTVFAPTDEAFAKLPAGTLDALLKDKAKLTAVLTYHVVPGKVMASDVAKLTEAKTVQGQNVKISTMSGVMVNDAHVVKTDILASNGVIHVIDKVILPN